MRLGASVAYGIAEHLAECPDLGPECYGPIAPTPYYHRVELWASDINLDVSYGVTSWFAAEARLALRIVDTTPTYSELDGSPKLVPNDIHHHDRTLAGPGDPWITARFGGAFGKLTTAARVGVSLPLGSTEPNPYTLARDGRWHEHTQLGSGTVIPIIGFGLSYNTESVELALSAIGFFSLSTNGYGFRAPSRFFAGLRGSVPLLKGRLAPIATFDVAHESNEMWDGLPGLEGNSLRTDLLVGLGLSFEFVKDFRAEVIARGRVARFSEGVSFDTPGFIQASVATHFDTAGK
ncbi:MAG: hypothetical protein IPK82_15385 [Polyangiaceae bacterium]|nr:hypothetical protein [Polyangiaceae bacterium]